MKDKKCSRLLPSSLEQKPNELVPFAQLQKSKSERLDVTSEQSPSLGGMKWAVNNLMS